MSKILVLGHRGMLGRTVYKYLVDEFYDVHTTDIRFPNEYLKDFIKNGNFDFVINCIGAIPQRTDSFSVNYKLPKYLSDLSYELDFKIIHPASDCEFSGKLEYPFKYDFNKDRKDPVDDYGKSKYKGTRVMLNCENAYVIAGSILGIEESTSYSLLGWFLNKNGDVNGYSNHYWNGVTALRWAEECSGIIDGYGNKGLTVLATCPISKYHLLKIFKKVFNKSNNINEVKTPKSVNRCLSTHFYDDIEKQLQKFKKFWNL